MTVFIGGPTEEHSGPLYDAWRHCLTNQTVETLFGPVYDSGEEWAHRWRDARIDRVASLRQRFFEHFLETDYSYACMVDSDVMIPQNCVEKLIDAVESHGAHVAYAVFWTSWDGDSPPQPQVWQTQPYGIPESLLRALERRQTVEVAGGGACTLFTREVAQKARYWPRIASLPHGAMWRGEDRTFALCCEVHQLTQIAVGDILPVHCYHPHQRTPEAIQNALTMVGQS